MQVEQITYAELQRLSSGLADFPFEQSQGYLAFNETQGHPVSLCVRWHEDAKTVAVAAFCRYTMRSIPFLWARRGPVWFSAPSPAEELEAREALTAFINRNKNSYAFVRMDQTYSHENLFMPLGLIAYDRTVVIDGANGDQVAATELLPKSGRRLLNQARKKLDAQKWEVVKEDLKQPEDFSAYYQILLETADRDGFHPHPEEYYWGLYQSVDPVTGDRPCRLYSLTIDDVPVCWDLVALNRSTASMLYGASSEAARHNQAPSILDFQLSCSLAEEGFKGTDMMGIHSPLTPQLYSVGRYKMQFAQTYKDVPRTWDYPLKNAMYRALRSAYNLRHRLMSANS